MPKRLRVQYRKASFVGGLPVVQTLQTLLRAALTTEVDNVQIQRRVRLRMMDLDDGGKLVLNSSQIADGYVFGELAAYDPGLAIRVIEDMAEQESLDLRQLPPPAGNHPVREVTYFMVRNNHVSLFEVSSLRSSHIERYISWLLKVRTGGLLAETQIFLDPNITYQGATRAHTAQITPPSLQLAPPMNEEEAQAEGVVDEAVGLRRRLIEGTQTYDILRAAGSTDADLESIMRQVGDQGRVQVTLGITVYSGRKKTETTATSIQRLLRHADEDEIKLYDSDGRTQGTVRRLVLPATVDVDGAYVVRTSARTVLLDALGTWAQKGYISLGQPQAAGNG